MTLVVLPQPAIPSLTVSALAKLMVLPAYSQTSELRDQKYPSGGGGRNRVPYYQQALTSLRAFIASGLDVRVLEDAVRDLEDRLAAAESDADSADQTISKLKSNLRTMGDVASFTRLRELSSSVQTPPTHKLVQGGVEVRSTPKLLLSGTRRVFIDFSKDGLDDDEARRTLELAHWVESEQGSSPAMGEFEYWMLVENRCLRWPTARKTTVNRARQTLPVIGGAWDRVEPPKSWVAAPAAARGGMKGE